MSEENTPKVIIDEKEYDLAESTDTAKYCYNQITSIKNQIAENAFKADQLKSALSGFEAALTEELTKDS